MNNAPVGKRLLMAEWLATMTAPPQRAGGVVFEGSKILAAGNARSLCAAHPDAEIIDAGSGILVPGLVNAHTHLELSDLSCGAPPTAGFVEWLREIRARSKGPRTDADVAAATRGGIAQSLTFGVTSVGDISQRPAVTRPILTGSSIGGVSYGEIIAFGRLIDQAELMLAAARDRTLESGRLRVGLSPHAPYTVDERVYRSAREMAGSLGYPLATHLAESADEAMFLSQHAGPFRVLWDSIGLWGVPSATFAGGSIRYAHALGLLGLTNSLLAHVNYCDDDELELLAEGVATVVYCPRTHAYFQHPPHRWRDMLARGINVTVGTDSCASSPDLNLVDDLRLLRRLAPEVPAISLWEMATARSAKALGQTTRVGTIAAGKEADLVVFPTTTDDPLEEILESALLPAQVWLAGDRIR